MDKPCADPLADLAARVVELEMLLTHFQRTISDLDSVVLAQQKQIESLERKLAACDANLASLASGSEPPLSPLDEKPPHY